MSNEDNNIIYIRAYRAAFWTYLLGEYNTSRPRETVLEEGEHWVPYVQPDKPNPPRTRRNMFDW